MMKLSGFCNCWKLFVRLNHSDIRERFIDYKRRDQKIRIDGGSLKMDLKEGDLTMETKVEAIL